MKRRVLKKKANIFLKQIRKPSAEFGFLVCTIKAKHHPHILPANIYIDDGGTWLNLGNKKTLLFQADKNFDRDWDNIIAMTIEHNPIILGKPTRMELSREELAKLKTFVTENQKEFIKLADDKICHLEFFENIGLGKGRKNGTDFK